MLYIVKWVLVLFVTVNNCQIRAIGSYHAVLTTKAQCDSLVLTLKTNKPEESYGDYVDSVRIDSAFVAPVILDYAKQDTVCK